MVGRLLIGTSGYSYDDWVGPVYPPGTERRDFLQFYAQRFRFTELNFPYYRMPRPGQLASMRDNVPSSFEFVVKATSEITHKRSSAWRADAAELCDRAGELGDAFAGLLLQFPFSFHYTSENRRHLANAADALPRPLFVEFRNAEWDRESVYREMERRSLALVLTDMPRLPGLPQSVPRLTADVGYLRLHGRNRDQWWDGTAVTRYDYLYDESELHGWAESVRQLSATADTIYVAFNNHFAGQAVTNAEQFQAMMGGSP